MKNNWGSGALRAAFSAYAQDIFTAILAQAPIIGPHGTDETCAELLLQGKKPLGWMLVPPPFPPGTEVSSEVQAQIDQLTRLTQAVNDGRLSFLDVTVNRAGNDRNVYRHYCQVGLERDLALMAAYNREAFNMQKQPTTKLEKNIGDYLGYRKRDQLFFGMAMTYGKHAPISFMNALWRINERITQPAYLKRLLAQPVKTRKLIPRQPH